MEPFRAWPSIAFALLKLAASALLSSTPIPYLVCSSWRRPARGWLPIIWAGVTSSRLSRPAMIASAITPQPIKDNDAS